MSELATVLAEKALDYEYEGKTLREWVKLIGSGRFTEVVRCKDCKHLHEDTGWCYHHSHFIGSEVEACHPWESNDWKMLSDDDFCSYGERKGNGI